MRGGEVFIDKDKQVVILCLCGEDESFEEQVKSAVENYFALL